MALSEARAEEIRHSYVICAQADFERREAEAALMNAERKIQATTALLDKVATGWKSERKRRKDLERQMAATYRELPLPKECRGQNRREVTLVTTVTASLRVAVLTSTLAACAGLSAGGKTSDEIYRIPYGDGTHIRVSNDHRTHNPPVSGGGAGAKRSSENERSVKQRLCPVYAPLTIFCVMSTRVLATYPTPSHFGTDRRSISSSRGDN